MFGFLIKKAFFDMWDNLIKIVILNLGFILLLAASFFTLSAALKSSALLFIPLGLLAAILVVYTGVVSWMTSQMADYSRPEWAAILEALRATWPTSLAFAGLNLLLGFLFYTGVRVYGQLQSFIGPLAQAFLLWVMVFWALASQYFFPIQARLDRRFFKAIKKMFLVLLYDPWFTVGLLIGSLLIFVLSFFTAFLLFGFSTILLWWNVALKLRLYKYDHLEKHPEDRRRVPWDSLLVEDRERVGKRTLKGMIFPWKE